MLGPDSDILPLRIGDIEGPPGGPANEVLFGVAGGIVMNEV